MPETSASLTKMEQITQLEKTFLFNTYPRLPLFIERAHGVTVWDINGKSYIDMLGGIAVNALGYAHPRVIKVIQEQIESSIHLSNLFYHPYQGQLAKKLVEISGLAKAFFTNSGTEAVEAAFKIARAYATRKGLQGKNHIVALENSFHGRTAGALSATGAEKYRKPFEPLLPNVQFAKPHNADDLDTKINGNTCAVIIEPIQGEAGIYPMTHEYLQQARALCDRYDALLIFDEIQCGLGRTGRYFYFQKFNIQPDLLTVAKSLAAGLPLGAVLGSQRLAEVLGHGDHGTTFGGGPLACRVALEFLAVLEEEGLLDKVRQVGDYFHNQLLGLKEKFNTISDVRGEGLMIGIELKQNTKPVVEKLLQAGFIANSVHDKVIRLLPPYIIEKRQIDAFISALTQILSSEVNQ